MASVSLKEKEVIVLQSDERGEGQAPFTARGARWGTRLSLPPHTQDHAWEPQLPHLMHLSWPAPSVPSTVLALSSGPAVLFPPHLPGGHARSAWYPQAVGHHPQRTSLDAAGQWAVCTWPPSADPVRTLILLRHRCLLFLTTYADSRERTEGGSALQSRLRRRIWSAGPRDLPPNTTEKQDTQPQASDLGRHM